jgi:HEAT repeat protein
MAGESIVPRVALGFSLLALAGSSTAVAVSWTHRRATSLAPAVAPVADADDVERRVTALERQIALLRVGVAARTADSKGAPMATVAGTIPPAEVADLAQRLARLEQLAATIEASHAGGRRLTPEAMAAATRTVLDRQASAEDRAAALTLLRPNDGRSDGRTHEVVAAALEVIQAPETSPKLRAGMIRDLDRLNDPALKDPLVGILSRDTDGRTRREVVETLAGFYDDPHVRSLIERLKDTDPEPQVRAQAMKQLGRWQARGQ